MELKDKFLNELISVMQIPDDWVGQDLEDWKKSVGMVLDRFAFDMDLSAILVTRKKEIEKKITVQRRKVRKKER